MRRSSKQQGRKARPGLEGLEGRQLLSTGPTPSATTAAFDRKIGVTLSDRRMTYRTPEGTRVSITLYGNGTLAGSTVDPDGALNLVFAGTNAQSGIVARVSGGTHRALLRTIKEADVGLDDLSGIGGSDVNVVNFKDFDLVDGGQINLTSGVHTFFLNTVGQNTQIHLREQPDALSTSTSTSGTISATQDGYNLQYGFDAKGALILLSVSGQFSSDFPAIVPQIAAATSTNSTGHNPGPPPAPPGIVASIGRVNGPSRASSSLGDPEVYAYDPAANSLIRFDTITGSALQTISLGGLGTMTTGVSLGRDHGQLVALVGNGTTVFAFNAVNGSPAGQFSTTNLAARGINAIDGLGSTDNRTVLISSTSGANGMAQMLDLTASLDTGQAVPLGSAFTPQREFGFSGGLTGVAGSKTVYVTGAGHFDTAQPNLTQVGILALNTTGDQLKETSRTALTSNGVDINAGPAGTAQSMPFLALGSIDQSLALVTGVANGQNVVTLYSPSTLAKQGTIQLDDPNQLVGLSESFRPELVDAALIDIQGNLQSLRGTSARGLVFNTVGYANLVKFQSVTDSTFVGLPFGHAQIPHRTNVTIASSKRTVGGRNGVTIQSNIAPTGPLSLPSPG